MRSSKLKFDFRVLSAFFPIKALICTSNKYTTASCMPAPRRASGIQGAWGQVPARAPGTGMHRLEPGKNVTQAHKLKRFRLT